MARNQTSEWAPEQLMLWRAKTTQDGVVGNSGQGMYWQGSDKPTDRIKAHWMEGLGTWRHAGGVPHACTGCKEDIVAGIITWDQVNPARVTNVPSLTGLQHRAEGVLQAAIPRP